MHINHILSIERKIYVLSSHFMDMNITTDGLRYRQNGNEWTNLNEPRQICVYGSIPCQLLVQQNFDLTNESVMCSREYFR